MAEKLLEIKDLCVEFSTKRGLVQAVSGATLSVSPGEVLGIVGESGSGKSTVAYAVMRLLKKPGRITGGSISFRGRELLSYSEKELQTIRGNDMAMIFQDPMQCLDPVYTIGAQMTETLFAHRKLDRAAAEAESIKMLAAVGLNDPEKLMKRYSFELSGGMQQRVMIAMALLCEPELLIADEATTALDVTVQDQIMQLLKKLRAEKDLAIMLITHNFGLVSDLCDRVAVMYGGRVVEEGDVFTVFYSARHPYTRGLIKAIPKTDITNDEKLQPIPGMPLDPFNAPKGCVFCERCEYCTDRCRNEVPEAVETGPGHIVSCHMVKDGSGED